MAVHRDNRSWHFLPLSIALFIAAGASAATAATQVCLAGTFNNWSTSDRAYQLKDTGRRMELTRFWHYGGYEFKFVFDGSWKRHLGDAGNGKLAQPGQDIRLSIKESGEYALWLDVKRKRWGLEKVTAVKPHAIAAIRRIRYNKYLLVSSTSINRSDHPISRRWQITARDLKDEDWSYKRVGGHDFLEVHKPGHFEITLTIDDGAFQDQTTIREVLGDGYDLLVRSDSSPTGRRMHPLGNHLWGAVYESNFDGQDQFLIAGLGLPDKSPALARAVQAKHRYLVVFDDSDRTLRLQSQGWHAFDLTVKDEPRLANDLRIERVEVLGDFNSWQPGRTPMSLMDPGHYQAVLNLPDGVHHYKFLINGCIYLQDLAADKLYRQPDGQGGHNSGFLMGPDAATLGPARPNNINLKAIKHDPSHSEYFSPMAGHLVRLTLRTLGDDVKRVFVLSGLPAQGTRMHRMDRRSGFDYWSAQMLVTGKELSYEFFVEDDTKRVLYNARGVHPPDENDDHLFRQGIEMTFDPPEWTKQAVWYQIFPERFRNGESRNDPPRMVPWSQSWYKPYLPDKNVPKGSPQDFEETGDFNEYIYKRRYGGDLQGIREKLPYLRDLGINAIYLNPIFQAESLHKYDASDYRHIDDFFGVRGSLNKIKGENQDPATWQWSASDRVFLDFLKEAHRQGFRVIIDGVFNHVGRGFWAFQDVLRNGRGSPYADWFDIISWKPFRYQAWDKENGSLPRLKHDEALGLCKPVRDHLFAVTRRWMDPDGDGDPSDGIDGWRLDVASDINENFWQDWRKVVKSINPNAYIVAELWQESGRWLDGRTFDAVMNYPFAERCQQFFVNVNKADSPKKFDRRLREMLGWYSPQVNYALQNLLDSHDTDRAASMFLNPDLPYDKANRLQDNGPRYNPAKPTPDCYRKLKLMATFQMTFLGAPMIYYGDEVGMYGADDPSCRKPMLWDDLPPNEDPQERIETDVYDHYRRMIAIRNTYPALRLGMYETLQADTRLGIFAFARTLGNQSIVVILNNSDQKRRLNAPSPWPDSYRILRLDDPEASELTLPPSGWSSSRPTIKPLLDRQSKYHVAGGRLQGGMLEARSGGVFYGYSITGLD